MSYLHWDEKTITDFSDENVASMYDRGYVFTRLGKGVMQQTRSVRVDLSAFELSSENRRILKKISDIGLQTKGIPYTDYSWEIAKLAKDFYSVKFGEGIRSIMGAAKVKEMLTKPEKSSFNSLFVYSQKGSSLGYTICYQDRTLLHYCYPFYELDKSPKDMGLGMMTLAIDQAKRQGLKYVYLGSLQRPGDTYKLQFQGLEWFDGQKWLNDIEEAKKVLKNLGK